MLVKRAPENKKKIFKFSMAKVGGLDQIEDDIKLCEQYLARNSSRDWERTNNLMIGSEAGSSSSQSIHPGCMFSLVCSS